MLYNYICHYYIDLHELTYDILISLTNVERFSMVLMFLKDSDKNGWLNQIYVLNYISFM